MGALTIRVTASDGASPTPATSEATFTLTVSAAPNNAPAFGATSYGFDLSENADGSSTAVAVGTVTATDADAGDTVSYSITAGNTGGVFAIDGSSGAITYTGTGEDYEGFTDDPMVDNDGPAFAYVLTVQASDGTASATVAVTVSVTNVNEAPVFGATSYGFDLSENADGSGTAVAVGTVSATDADAGDAVAYSITAGNTGSVFAIDGSSGAITYTGSGEDYESFTTPASAFTLTVQASDGTASATVAVTIRVTNVNEPPGTPSLTNQSATVGTAFSYQFAAVTDPEGATPTYAAQARTGGAGTEGDPYTYGALPSWLTFTGDGGDDSVETDDRLFSGTPVAADVGALTIRVTASDGASPTPATSEATFTLTVSAAPNNAPAFGATSYGFDLSENADGSSTAVAVGTVTATDADAGDTVSYSITAGNTGGVFAIDGSSGAITYTGTGEDYEGFTDDPMVDNDGPAFAYVLTVQASDGTASATVAVTVSVTNVNEAPVFGATSYGFDLSENADGSGTAVAVGTVSATDADAGDAVAYSITAGNTGSVFAIDGSSGAITYTGSGEDYESFTTPASAFTLTVQASDGTASATVAVTIRVTNVNEPPGTPSLTNQSATVGTAFSYQFAAVTDPEGATPTYAAQARTGGAGTEGDPYTYGALPSWLTFTGDGGDDSVETDDRLFSGTPVAADVGALTIRVTASDGASPTPATSEATFALTVSAAPNSAPAFGATSYGFDLSENADGSSTAVAVGTVSATDADSGDTVAYSITAGNTGGVFAIDGSSGAITYTGTGEDYEGFTDDPEVVDDGPAFAYVLTVQASDGAASATVAVTVSVTNVNEPPGTPSLTNRTATAGTAFSYQFAAVTDPEGATPTYAAQARTGGSGTESDPYTYGALPSWLTFTGDGGDDSVETDDRLFSGTPAEANVGALTIRVTASDGASPTPATSEATFMLTVSAAPNNAPAFGATSYAFDLAENADGSSAAVAVGTVSATDADAGDTVAYSITAGNTGGVFAIDGSSGAITYTGTGEDYESFTDDPMVDNDGPAFAYVLTVQASDGTASATVAVTVSVTNVNEAPAFGEDSYGFDLSENADGSSTAVAVGTVSATDADAGDTVAYSITAGNTGGVFAIDGSSGAITYTGTGEDYEGFTDDPEVVDDGPAFAYVLTVQASDGAASATVAVTVSVTNVNEPPGTPALTNQSATVGTSFSYQFAAVTDPEGATPTYAAQARSGAGTEGSPYAYGALPSWLTFTAGTRTFSGTPGEDGAGSLTIRVTASDGASPTPATSEATFALTVSAAAISPPVFGAASYGFNLAENADGSGDDAAIAVGTVSATAADAGDTVSYSITAGNTGGVFAIDGSSGAITYTGTGEDYESFTDDPMVDNDGPAFAYVLTVQASDGTASATVAVTVSVTNVNEAPTAKAGPDQSVTEGDTVTLAGSGTDPEGQTLTYAWTAPSGVTLSDATAAAPTFTAPDRTADYTLTFSLKVNDGTSDSAADTVDVSVTADNDAPTAKAGPDQSVTEGDTVTLAGSGTDPEGQTLTYAWTAPSGVTLSDATAAAPTFTAPDREANYTLTFSLKVNDGNSDSAADTVDVSVSADNDAPGTPALTDQSATAGAPFSYQFAAVTDPEGATPTYAAQARTGGSGTEGDPYTYGALPSWLTFTGDGGDDSVETDDRLFSGTPVAADVGALTIRVTASDGASPTPATSEATFTLTVSAAPNNAPAFGATSYGFDLSENADGSSTAVAVGTVTATDADAGDTVSYSITAGNTGGVFAIDGSSGAITYTGTGEDYEGFTDDPMVDNDGPAFAYVLTVQASDGTASATVAVTVSVTNVNEAPVFGATSYGFDLSENADGSGTAVAVGTVSATDADAGDAVAYSITAGNTGSVFAIDGSSGAITYTGSGEDYESFTTPASAFTLTVQASDGTASATVAVTIRVTNVNEPPGTPSLTNQSATVGTAFSYQFAAVTDPEGATPTYAAQARTGGAGTEGDPYTYGALPSWLTFTGDGGDDSVETDDRLFSGTPVAADVGALTIRVTASDGASPTPATSEATFTLTVSAAPNNAPAFGATSYGFDLSENADGSSTAVAVGTVTATDADAGDTVSYSITAGNTGGVFAIDGSSGAITYTGTGEDYEGFTDDPMVDNDGPAFAYVLTVQASDGTASATVAVTVSVTNVNEAPVFGATSYGFDLSENADGSGTAVAVGTVSATDADAGDAVAYSITAGNTGSVFAIDGSSGAITYTGSGEDYESFTTPASAFTLTVQASDGTASATVAVTIRVTNVNEPPGTPSLTNQSATVGTAFSYQFAAVTDPEGATPTYAAQARTGGAGTEGDPYTYGALPSWLTFTGDGGDDSVETDDRLFSGTPVAADVGALTIRVTASDGASPTPATSEATFALTVSAAPNSAPAFGATSYGFDLSENADGSSTAVAVGTVSATDADSGDTVAYSITAGNTGGVFAIDGSSGAITYTGTGEDYEGFTDDPEVVDDGPAFAYVLTVQASDGAASATVAVTVSVTNVNEPPGTPSLTNRTATAGTAFSYQFAAVTDPEGATPTYAAQARTGGSGTESDPYTYGALPSWLTFTGDGGDDSVETDDRLFSGTPAEANVGALTIRVTASDGASPTPATSEATFMLTVSAAPNNAPAFGATSYAFDLAENADGSSAAVAVGTVSATDADAGDTVAYSITAGNTGGVFAIDGSSGAITYTGTGEDYESFTDDPMVDNDGPAFAYVLTVQASDGTASATVAVTVSVTNVNEAPAFGEDSYGFDLSENADGSSTAVAVGTVSATDADAGDTVAYSITAGNTGGVFAIDGSSGAITYTGTGEDYEGFTDDPEVVDDGAGLRLRADGAGQRRRGQRDGRGDRQRDQRERTARHAGAHEPVGDGGYVLQLPVCGGDRPGGGDAHLRGAGAQWGRHRGQSLRLRRPALVADLHGRDADLQRHAGGGRRGLADHPGDGQRWGVAHAGDVGGDLRADGERGGDQPAGLRCGELRLQPGGERRRQRR